MDKIDARPPLSNAKVTADVAVFTVDEGMLKVLLVSRRSDPYKGQLALPGGFQWQGETTSETAARILRSKANVGEMFIEQLYTFDSPKRDPRGHILSVTYFALVPAPQLLGTVLSSDARLVPVNEAPSLPFDHNEILDYAVGRLKTKLSYSNVAYSLLPELFSLSELQDIYEVILGRTIDKRNFRKKISSLDIIEPSGQKRTGERHRPALLYRFKKRGFSELDEPVF